MSTPINDGGLAFPYRETESTGQYQHHYGMTLRDYFAGQVMHMLLNGFEDVSKCDDQDLLQRFGTENENNDFFTHVSSGQPTPWKNIELRAKLESRARAFLRYAEADAMLAAREEVTK